MIAAPVRSLEKQRAESKRNPMIEHWVGLFHAIARNRADSRRVVYLPGQRFVVIPAVIVALYAVTIDVLPRRPKWMEVQGT